VENFQRGIGAAQSIQELLGHEANFAKNLYAYHAQRTRTSGFSRTPQGLDTCNQLIDNGNYLAYGLAASVLWVLGIPHAFPVTQGMTRRGALVFDVADVIKDAMLLPLAFDCTNSKEDAKQHRALAIAALDKFDALKTLYSLVIALSERK
jgi:CRISPR-associated protein Cas1